MQMNILVTDRCTLLPQAKCHAEEMYNVLCDPAIYEFENAPPQSVEWLAARYARLETRTSPDKTEHWLNWVIRVANGELIGYVQATIFQDGLCHIAYELSSKYWRMGFGRAAVTAMMCELTKTYSVKKTVAVLKARNFRSRALLLDLGFAPASDATIALINPETDEIVMTNSVEDNNNKTQRH